MAITAGLYEIRSMLLTSMAVDVAGGKAVNGANVQIYAANDTNAQKFRLTQPSSGQWAIVNANSGLYVDVAGGRAQSGTNVQQYSSNGSRAQRWNIVETGGTVTIDGIACPVVTIYSYVTTDGTTYAMDVRAGMTTNSTNVQIYAANNSDAQHFALVPTTLLDRGMPAPAAIGWSREVGGQGQREQPEAATLYPTWAFTSAWDATEDHGFEYATRTRSTAGGDAAPGAWSAWSAWAPAAVTTDDGTAWLTAGVDGSVAASDKSRDVNLRVRPTSTAGGEATHGQAASAVLTATAVAACEVTAVALGPESLVLTVASDYSGGTNYVTVTSVSQGGADLLAESVDGSGYGPTFEVEVPISSLAALPEVGGTADVFMAVGTDQYAPTGEQATTGVAVTWAAGRTVALAPTESFDADAVDRVDPGATGTLRAWAFAGGRARAVDVSSGAAVVPYPFGAPCVAYVTVDRGTAWGSAVVEIAAADPRRHRPCHAWTWEGGTLVLDGSTGDVSTQRTVKGRSDALELDSRPWQVVTFGPTMEGTFKASGTLGASTTDDLEALVAAHHALYRAPGGQVADVAVTDVSYEQTSTITTANVSMVQEAR